MPSDSGSRLGDSWVVNNVDEGELSWADDSIPSDVEEKSPTRNQHRNRKTNKMSTHSPSYGQPDKSAYQGLETSGPDLIMPSIGEARNQPRTRAQVRSKAPKKGLLTTRDTRSRTSAVRHEPDARHAATSTAGDKALDIASHVADWLLDVLGQTLRFLKKPTSWVLAAYLFAGLLTLLQNLLTSSIYSAFSPVCRIPGISLLKLPVCQYSPSNPTLPSSSDVPAPEFDALMTVQSQFEAILTESASGVSLPLDMKRSETSIRDLRQVVRFSHLPSKNELIHEFDGFIETARIASYDLQKFNSHVGRGVDIVLSTARWTQRVLDDIDYQQSQRGLVPSFINNRLLAPFQPVHFTEARLLDQYIQHTQIVSDEIEKLIEEAQTLLQVLQNLEDRLDVIHSISIRDNIQAQGSKDEILIQLWTLIGGNRAKIGKYNNQLKLLQRVGEYRKIAFAHVSGTILKLQAMGTELEELRTRVGSAEALRDAGIKNVPLSVHIENIRLGVERLEAGRENARELERGHVRQVIDGSKVNDGKEIKYLVDG